MSEDPDHTLCGARQGRAPHGSRETARLTEKLMLEGESLPTVC